MATGFTRKQWVDMIRRAEQEENVSIPHTDTELRRLPIPEVQEIYHGIFEGKYTKTS